MIWQFRWNWSRTNLRRQLRGGLQVVPRWMSPRRSRLWRQGIVPHGTGSHPLSPRFDQKPLRRHSPLLHLHVGSSSTPCFLCRNPTLWTPVHGKMIRRSGHRSVPPWWCAELCPPRDSLLCMSSLPPLSGPHCRSPRLPCLSTPECHRHHRRRCRPCVRLRHSHRIAA